jgi:uncharacterized Zn finger protein
MTVLSFDTHAYVKKLIASGFTEQQAEAQVEALVELVSEQIATKRDLKEGEARLTAEIELIRRDMKEIEAALRRDMKELENRLVHQIEMARRDTVIKLGTIVVAGFTLVTAIFGVLLALIQNP